MFADLREFIDRAEKMGEVKVVEGADCETDIGALTELGATVPEPPLLMFDRIKGHQPGFRVASNLFASQRRTALGLGLPEGVLGIDLVRAMREKIRAGIPLLPPEEVKTGPVMENVQRGDEVDLLKFPSPKWHELDGGRYIGTGTIGISRDPDEGWVNFGTYRVQVHDKNTITVWATRGHHHDIIQKKYWAKGKPCPVAVSCGQDPVLFAASAWEHVAWGTSEYDFAGGLRGAPVQVVKGVATGLPVPATAEIVIEGEIVPPEVETRMEGPFGEWWGYYGGKVKAVSACKVKSVMYRNNPIIQGNPPSGRPSVWTLGRHIQKAATLWDELDRHIPGVTGVWMVEEASMHAMPVISLKQMYGGHAKQAALIAAGCNATGRASRIIMVVDDDINPSNMSEVIWALATRCNFETAVDVIKDCWDSPSDPLHTPEDIRLNKRDVKSRALLIACRPYWCINEFPPSISPSAERIRKTQEKWGDIFGR